MGCEIMTENISAKTGPMALRTTLDRAFMEKVLFVIFCLGLCWLAVILMPLWLLVFGAALIGQILKVVAEPLTSVLKIPERFAIMISLVILLWALGLGIYLFGRDLILQLLALVQQIPQAWDALSARLLSQSWGEEVLGQIQNWGAEGAKALMVVPRLAGNILSTLTTLLLVTVGGVYMAMNTNSYGKGIVGLFPIDRREAVSAGIKAASIALRRWLLGQTISMLFVGVLIAAGLSLLEVKSALALGLIAGLAQFVPVVGPLIATIPALVMTGAGDYHDVGWVLLLYVTVSQLEANLVTPLVQKEVTEVPVALNLFAVVGFAMLFGPLGVVFASPLTVVCYTLIVKFYADNGWHDAGTKDQKSDLNFATAEAKIS
jgi:predicted PurR-regulated permease PerM